MNTTHGKTLTFVFGSLLGIVIGYDWLYGSELVVALLVIIFIQGTIYLVKRKRGSAHENFLLGTLTVLFSLGLCVGIIRVQLIEEKEVYLCSSACTYTGEIVSSIETKNEYQLFKVRPLDTQLDTYDVLVRVPLYPRYQVGETLSLSGVVAKPKTLEPHNGKKFFDYTSYLATRNVGSEMYYPHVEVIDEEAHDVTSYLGRLKESLVKKINFYVSSPSSELATGMLFGNSSMSDELVQVFRTAGLSHIIVLSGFNIAVVIAFVLLVFSFLPLVLRIFLASITVILFVMMVGGEASVIRATLMAFVSLLATLVGRKYVAHQALILSLFVIVMYEPQALLYDASLHLSFLATVGIVYLVPGLDRYLAGIQSITLRELCATTIAAYLSTLPYIMYTFGTVSTYALIANIFVLPLVPFAMLVSFVLVIMSFISETITVLIGYVDTFLISGMIFVADVIEYLPFASIGISITRNEMLLIYLVLISGVVFLFSKKENETRVMSAGDKEEEFLTDIIKF